MLRIIAICLSLAVTPVFAQTDSDKAALDTLLAEMTEEMKSGNILASMKMLPPAILDTMAKQSGLDKDKLLEVTRNQMEASGNSVKFTEIEFGGDDIEWKKTENGKLYALVPSTTVVETKDATSGVSMKMKQTATYVAIPDDGKWYVVDISNPMQKGVFASAYPDYAGITVPEGSMEMVQ